MTRFRCVHCGGRIAVHKRHLGRLARCPECGSDTHPLAEHILGGQRTAHVPSLATRLAETAHPIALRLPRSGIVLRQKSVAALARAPETTLARARTDIKTSESPTFATMRLSSEEAPGPFAQDRMCSNCSLPIGRLQKPVCWHGHMVCTPCHRSLSAETLDEAQGQSRTATGSRALAAPLPTPAQVVRVMGPDPIGQIALDLRGGLQGALVGLFVTGAALFLAITLIQYIGLVVTWFAFGSLALLGLYWLRRGIAAMRLRLRELRALRVEHGAHVVRLMARGWARSRGKRGMLWNVFLMIVCGGMYAVYSIVSSFLPPGAVAGKC